MASRNPRWLEFLAFARMVKHLNRLGQTFSLHSADSFRCLVMPLSDLRISRAPVLHHSGKGKEFQPPGIP